MTNFHLPRSTLFMLVCAFTGMETMQAAYEHAKAGGWGDMMVCEGLKEMALWVMHESGYPEELQVMHLSLNDFRALK